MRKKETKIIVDDETEANVTETINPKGEKTQRINYTAKVKENDVIEADENAENQDENFDDENDFVSSANESQEIPKNQLMQMFDDLRQFSTNTNDYFYAMASRIPDAMSDNFIIRCNTEAAPIHFQFGVRDMLSFTENLQKVNNGSGGRFNVAILSPSMVALKIPVGSYLGRREFREVGLINFYVPNPQITLELNANNGQSQNNLNGLDVVFGKMVEMMQNNHNQLMQVINRPQEKSEIENLLMTKAIDKLMNPEQPQSNQFEQTMATIMAMPVMVEKMSAKMFPAPPVEREPTTLDTIQSIVAMPVVENTATALLNGLSMIVEAKMQEKQQGVIQNLPNETIVNPQLNQIQTATENNEMKELLQDIIAELESDSVFDETNEFLIELKNEFPTQTMMIESICKTQSFENVLQLLITQADSIKPQNPFVEFLDVTETQKQQKYVWTERGNKLIKRLNEFYEFVKK